jgi:O-acetyl-ADP-ribose deacetylase (regulator of RNase III)
LEIVDQYQLRTVALCGISTGIYGYPKKPAASVAISSVRKWLETDENHKKV